MSKGRIKMGIYLCAILMMGVIAVSSNIANIIAHFAPQGVDQTLIITYLISVPCLVVIPVTIITGVLFKYVAKKILMIVGVLCWLIGGVTPYFMGDLSAILGMRVIFGVGVGMVQTCCNALVVENFEDPAERDKVMGTMNSFQMLGAIFFSIVAGNLGSIGWNIAFLVHLMALVSLIACFACVPYRKPVTVTETGEKVKFKPTAMMWIWVISYFIYMIAGQTYSNFASSIITEKGLGTSAAAGYSRALFAFGGFVCGFLFAKIAKACKRLTLTVGCVLLAISYVIMTFAPSLVVSYIGAFVCGLAFSICMPCLVNGTANSVDVASSGMAVSIATCLQNAGMAICPYIVTPLGGMIANPAAGFTVNQGGMIVGAIIIAVFAVLFAIINTRQKSNA